MTRATSHSGLVLMLALALAVPVGRARAGFAPGPEALARPAHPGRIIVKYRPNVTACAHCLLAKGTPFASVTGTDSLDHLNADLGVRRARSLFFEDHSNGRSAAYAATLDGVRNRFASRSARAATGAVPPDLSNVYVLDLPRGADVAAAAAQYARDPDVEYAEPDYQVHVALDTNDPYLSSVGSWGQSYPDLWGIQTTQAPQAWDTATGQGVVVAVIDTGVKYTHRDLAANVWTNPGEIPKNRIDDDGNGYVDDIYGWDFVKNRNHPKDRHGHGTHVAGTIAAVGNNAEGVIGLAWNARIMVVRGIGANGTGWSSDLARCIVYAAQNGADVLNNSWGGFGVGTSIIDAVNTATSLGAVVVFAAGNEASSGYWLGPANLPQVIAVGATAYPNQRAGFSNYGSALSVAAPGVDILSLKGPRRVGGQSVGGRYRRLSGTSMATPHVAGLSALLLSALPSLTPDEVRWHLELNADQPGYPGYEGHPWNPYFGWGRINAARVFNPVPVTTRVRTKSIRLHSFAGAITPDAAKVDFSFTTLSPVDWALSGPPWLSPSVTNGSGTASVPLVVDGTSATPGSYSGSVVVSAAAAVDGGGSVPASAELHRDERIGGEILIPRNVNSAYDPPALATDGDNTLVVWSDGLFSLVAARIDAAGNTTGPFTLMPTVCVFASCHEYDTKAIGAAWDGTNYLVAWREYYDTLDFNRNVRTRQEWVKALRVTAAGQPLDASPSILASQTQTSPGNFYNFDVDYARVQVAFDGSSYAVMWEEQDENGNSTDRSTVYVRRVGTNGALQTAALQVYPTPGTAFWQLVWPRIACTTNGSCLIAWVEWDGQTPPAGQNFVRNTYGVRLVGGQLLNSSPAILVANTDFNDDFSIGLASNGTDYLVFNARNSCPSGPGFCGYDVVAARISGSGVPIDGNPIQVNRRPAQGDPSARPLGLTFDGTNYIATFFEISQATFDDSQYYTFTISGYPIFAARIGLDGSVLDNEAIGLLAYQGNTALSGEIVSTSTHSVLVWHDLRLEGPSTYGSLYAQRLLAH